MKEHTSQVKLEIPDTAIRLLILNDGDDERELPLGFVLPVEVASASQPEIER